MKLLRPTRQAESTPNPILVDRSLLRLWASSDGPQHDERKRTLAEMPRWLVWGLSQVLPADRIGWTKGIRVIPHDAPLHPSVLGRFSLPAILAYDETVP